MVLFCQLVLEVLKFTTYYEYFLLHWYATIKALGYSQFEFYIELLVIIFGDIVKDEYLYLNCVQTFGSKISPTWSLQRFSQYISDP